MTKFTTDEMAEACRIIVREGWSNYGLGPWSREREKECERILEVLEAAAAYIEATANVPPHGTDDGGD